MNAKISTRTRRKQIKCDVLINTVVSRLHHYLSLFRMSNSGALSVGDIKSGEIGDQSNTNDPTTTSDEHIDPYCELCVEEKRIRIAAAGLCKECNTFGCQQCLKAHWRWPGMRNHKILQGDDMPRTVAQKPVKYPACDVHTERVNDHFCLDHQKMFCSQCIMTFHKTCTQSAVSELCQTLGQGDVRKFRDSIEKSIQTANSVKLAIQQNKEEIENQRKAMIKDAKELKKSLDTKIQNITVDDTMITEVCKQKTSVLDDQAEAACESIQSLQNNMFIIDEFDGDIVTPNTFIALRRITEKTHAAHKELNDVSSQHRNVSLSFVPNPAITKFISSRIGLGKIKQGTTDSDAFESFPEINFPPNLPSKSDTQIVEEYKRMHLAFLIAYFVVYCLIILQSYTQVDQLANSRYAHTPVTEQSEGPVDTVASNTQVDQLANSRYAHIPVTEQSEAKMDTVTSNTEADITSCDILNISLITTSTWNVKTSDVKMVCYITGMIVTADGTLLLTDWIISKVKAFTGNGTFLSSITLFGYPYTIPLINSTTALLSIGYELQLLNVSSPSALSVQRSVYLGYHVSGLTVYNNKLVVISKTSVKMIDLDGYEIWSRSLDPSS